MSKKSDAFIASIVDAWGDLEMEHAILLLPIHHKTRLRKKTKVKRKITKQFLRD